MLARSGNAEKTADIALEMKKKAISKTPRLLPLSMAVGIITLSAFLVISTVIGLPQRLWGLIGDKSATYLGLRIANMTLDNIRLSSKEQITEVIQGMNRSILLFDLQYARDRLQKLPWIDDVIIRKEYPDHLYIQVIEQNPLAFWPGPKEIARIIDVKGRVIPAQDDRKYGQMIQWLPVFKGDGAQIEKLIAFHEQLKKYPILNEQIKSFEWVGDRRWNVTLRSGFLLMFPEENQDKPDILFNALAKVSKTLLNDPEVYERFVYYDLRIQHQEYLLPRNNFSLKGSGERQTDEDAGPNRNIRRVDA